MPRLGDDLLWRHDAGWRTFGIDSSGLLHEVVGIGPLSWRRSRVALAETATARVWFLRESLELQLEFPDNTYLHFRFTVPRDKVQGEVVTEEAHVGQLAAALQTFIDDVRTPSDAEFREQSEAETDKEATAAAVDDEADTALNEVQATQTISAEDLDSWSFGTAEGGYRVEAVEALLELAVATLRSYELDRPGGPRISAEEVRSAVFEAAPEGYVWQEVDEIIERVAVTLAFYETTA